MIHQECSGAPLNVAPGSTQWERHSAANPYLSELVRVTFAAPLCIITRPNDSVFIGIIQCFQFTWVHVIGLSEETRGRRRKHVMYGKAWTFLLVLIGM